VNSPFKDVPTTAGSAQLLAHIVLG